MKDVNNNTCKVVNGQLRSINPNKKKITVPAGTNVIYLYSSERLKLETLTLPVLSKNVELTIYDCAGDRPLKDAMANIHTLIVPSGLKQIHLVRHPIFGESLKNVVINGCDSDIGSLILLNSGIESVTMPIDYKYIDKLPRNADLKTINMVIDEKTNFANLEYPYNDKHQENFWSMFGAPAGDQGYVHWNNLKNAEAVNIEFNSVNSFIECIENGNFLKLCAYLKLLAKKPGQKSQQYANVKYKFICKDSSDNRIMDLLNSIYQNVGYSISVFETIVRYLCNNLDDFDLSEDKLEKIKNRTSEDPNFGLAIKFVLCSLSEEDSAYIPLEDSGHDGFKESLIKLHEGIQQWFDLDESFKFEKEIKTLCLDTFKELLTVEKSVSSIIDAFIQGLQNINKKVLSKKRDNDLKKAKEQLGSPRDIFRRTMAKPEGKKE